MSRGRRRGFPVLLLCGFLLLTACARRDSIGRILADPGRYQHQNITVAGTVIDSYGALGAGAYVLDDGTGTIWVITRRGVPVRGVRVGATGRLFTGFSLGGRTFGTVVQETDRDVH